MRKKFVAIAAALVMVMGMAGVSFGALVDWADWTSATAGNAGSVSGTIGSITVNYSGEVKFAQTSGGTDYWNTPSTPFISPAVQNAPPASDLIALVGGNAIVNTITFGQSVANPVMAILSLGQTSNNVTYNFVQPFTILSYGPGHWLGAGTLSNPSGYVLQGDEGNGVIQFNGTFSSISWTVPNSEDWHGFTVGLVPVPPSVLLLGSGLLGLVGLRYRRRKAGAKN